MSEPPMPEPPMPPMGGGDMPQGPEAPMNEPPADGDGDLLAGLSDEDKDAAKAYIESLKKKGNDNGGQEPPMNDMPMEAKDMVGDLVTEICNELNDELESNDKKDSDDKQKKITNKKVTTNNPFVSCK